MFAPIADHARLRDMWICRQSRLKVGRRDILAARQHDDFLLAIRYRDVAVRVDRCDVARMQPPFAIDRFARFRIAIEVALHDTGPPQQELSVGRGARLDVLKWWSHRADLDSSPNRID